MLTTHAPTQADTIAIAEISGESSVVIQATPQKIYDYLVDFTHHPEWVANLSKVTQVSAGANGVGAIYHTQESAPPVPFFRKLNMMRYFIAGLLAGTKPYSEAEVTGLEPGRRIAWREGVRKGEGWFNRAEWEIALQPQGQGTRVTQRFRYLPQTTAAARMVGAAGDGGIERACAVSLQQLKRILES
jgi:uncharacterized protein YndB with AHSA1/START domain